MLIYLCDGGSKGNPGPSRIGVVGWSRIAGTSSARRVTPSFNLSEDIGIATNNDAEWQAVLKAAHHMLKEVKKNEQVFIYSDSLLVVSQANKEWKVKDIRMKKYLAELESLIPDDINLKIIWIPRQLTMLADKET